MKRIALLSLLVVLGLPPSARAESVVLYANDFETPNQTPVASCGNSLDITPINTMYGTAGFAFEQTNTVETVFITDPGGLYSNPQGLGGGFAVGMLATAQNDFLALTFDSQSLPFVNVAFLLSSIDISGCGGPFGTAVPIMEVSLLDSPGGAFGWGNTVLDQVEVTGTAAADSWTFDWSDQLASLDSSSSTDGWISVKFDLLQSGYAAFDELSITSSTEDDIIDTDLDEVADDEDNCVDVPNTDQLDADGDDIGDACDDCPLDGDPGDADGDGVCDSDDACAGDDALGDADGDGVCDDLDLCTGDDASGDADGDGWCASLDCIDSDATFYPGASELCDGLDNDCDGVVPAEETDGDGDGVLACEDCDDDDPDNTPDGVELCDGLDNDCDGVLPDDETDWDGDGVSGCDGDCDDADPGSYPGAEELCDDGLDNDCDGIVDPDDVCGETSGGCDCESSLAASPRAPAALALLLVLTLRRRR